MAMAGMGRVERPNDFDIKPADAKKPMSFPRAKRSRSYTSGKFDRPTTGFRTWFRT